MCRLCLAAYHYHYHYQIITRFFVALSLLKICSKSVQNLFIDAVAVNCQLADKGS